MPEAPGGTSQPEVAAARPLPAVPSDDAKDIADFVDGKHLVLGRDALDFSQCEIAGTAMVINPGGIAAGNADSLPAWALYRITGLTDAAALSLNGDSLPRDFDMSYRVAVADYRTMEWCWLGPTSLPEYQFELSAEHQFISDQGNLHFLLVCDGANSTAHYRSTVVLDDAGDTNQPPATLYDLAGYVYGITNSDPTPAAGGVGISTGSAEGDPAADQNSPLVRLLDTETEDIANEEYTGGGSFAQPLAGVSVLLLGDDGTKLQDARTDDDGYFELNGIEPGDYLITTQLAGWLFQPSEYPVSLSDKPDGTGTVLQLDFLGWPISLTLQ